MFSEHNNIHLQLRNREWVKNPTEPPQGGKWSEVEAYMGLFEHCMSMLDDKLIDWGTFKDIYRYRLANIVSSPVIVGQKLVVNGSSYKRFIRLTKGLGLGELMIESGQQWLNSEQGTDWLNTPKGKQWLSTTDSKDWIDATRRGTPNT